MLENNENRNESLPAAENSRQINLVVNRPESDETTVDLLRVLHNMRMRKRIFAWVLVLCLVIGICAPLFLYQFSKAELTVSSVVTLRYEVAGRTVTDLTAPDGTDLDLNQITSAYVLQTALDSMQLSKPITADALRNNIQIRTILTEESRRTKEALAGLVEAKNAEAYTQMQTAEMEYKNRFIVSLANGFKQGEEDRNPAILRDEELRQVLDRVLTVYNDYLVKTYADIKLPEDTFSVIDAEELDVLDSLDQLRSGISRLYSYCREKSDTVKAYRSSQTGRSLADWMETLQTFRSINVDYLYSMVSENAITMDKTTLMTGWKYLLREAQNDLDEVNERIAETKKLLDAYKNDEVIVSMQESDAAKSTKASTAYYNSLVLQQAEDYEKVADLKATIADYTDRITRMDASEETDVTEEVKEELTRSLESAKAMYEQINAHMEELFESTLYKTYASHSTAQGKSQGFLAANVKKMIIGGVAGAVITFGLWFLMGLLPELSTERKAENKRKEAEAK